MLSMFSPMTRISGYHIDEALVAGPRSSVFRARREKDNLPVILKVVDSQGSTLRNVTRLKHEHQTIKLLKHESLIKTYSLEKHDHLLVLVLEDIGGISLFRYLKDRAISPWQALDIYIKATRQLALIHSFQIIHKDINPTNIVLNPKTGDVRITDFSISSRVSLKNRNPIEENLEGTLAYISPEQTGRMNRDVDYRTDFYSLGVSLYETLTGRLPFTSKDPMELIHCHLARNPLNPSMFNAEIPGMISEIILKLMAKNAEDRYQSCKGIINDLDRCLSTYRSTGNVEYFPPGQCDVAIKLRIPQKLYGREEEKALITERYEKIKTGAMEIIVLSGAPGTGRSALINELHKIMVRHRAYFISGKSDLYQRNIPYASLIQAFGKLTRKLLAESTNRLEYWKKRILENLGANARIMTEVIPEVELIVGPQQPVADLPPGESENRFSLVFRRFVGVFASPEHPLVLFLDDLQWADTATLKIIEQIAADKSIKSLLIICSYQEDEVTEAHPILETIDLVEASPASVSQIHLGPFPREVVTQIVSDALRMDREEIQVLADLVFEKTKGNPFFINEYLMQLSENKLLVFNEAEEIWQWDASRISGADLGEDAIEILMAKIARLGEGTQRILKHAACLGNRFSLAWLAPLCNFKRREALEHIMPAIEHGLVFSLEDITFSAESKESNSWDLEFVHDQIQQACYALTSADERKYIHLSVGRAMALEPELNSSSERLFEVVNQYNLGVKFLKDETERESLMKMNLLAGKKALNSVAYEPALGYFSTGISLLPEFAWSTHYQTALELHLKRAQCEYLLGHNKQADNLFEEALARAETVPEMAEIYNLRTLLHTHKGMYFEAIEIGLAGLELLDISLPGMDDLAQVEMGALLQEIRSRIGNRTLDQLLDQPEMKEPTQLAAMALLGHIWAPAMNMNRNLMNLVVLKIVDLSLKYGNTSITPCGYVGYGLIIGSLLGNYAEGDEFGKLALELSTRYDNPELASQVRFMYGAFVHPWRYHFRVCLPYLRESWRIGLESGNLVFASYSAFHIILQRFSRGDQLDSIARECQKYMDLLKGFNDDHHFLALKATSKMIRLLSKPIDEEGSWHDDDFNQNGFLETVQRRLYISALIHFYNSRVRVCYFLGDYEAALKGSLELERYAAFSWGWPTVAEQWFFGALSRAAIWDNAPDPTRSKLLMEVTALGEKLKPLALNSPANFRHRYLLVSAETARLAGRNDEAMDLYDEAIDSARKNEFSDVEALAFELAGHFFLARKKERIARIYLKDACFRYAQWGAHGAVTRLQQQFPYLGDLEERDRTTLTTTATTSAGQSDSLDLASFMKASRVISGEMHLGPLLEKLLHIALENAGAEKGYLILEKMERLYVEAEGIADREPVTILNIGPMGPHNRLSSAIVNYVYHTGQYVVLGNAAKEGLFTSDPYVFRNRPKSLLCLPLISHGKPIGVLYLENNLAPDAFSDERLEILKLITSEASISIENARLYTNLDKTSKRLKLSNEKLEEQNRTLEQKVDERTFELKDKNAVLEQTLDQLQAMQQQIIQQEKLASLGTLTAGIAHEIRNPLNFVNNFSELSCELLSDLAHELKPITEAYLKGDQKEWVDQLITDLQTNLKRIREHGIRADAVVNSMLRHSYDKTVTMPEATDINQLIDEYLMLSYHGIRAQNTSFNLDIRRDYDIQMDTLDVVAQDFSRVVINMMENACFAIQKKQKENGHPFKGVMKITTKDLGHVIELRFWDNGTGIPKEVRDKVFNPFFTTKPAGEGTGLGLSITNEIVVNGHGGSLAVDSKEGEWTEFVIQLPKRPKFVPKA